MDAERHGEEEEEEGRDVGHDVGDGLGVPGVHGVGGGESLHATHYGPLSLSHWHSEAQPVSSCSRPLLHLHLYPALPLVLPLPLGRPPPTRRPDTAVPLQVGIDLTVLDVSISVSCRLRPTSPSQVRPEVSLTSPGDSSASRHLPPD